MAPCAEGEGASSHVSNKSSILKVQNCIMEAEGDQTSLKCCFILFENIEKYYSSIPQVWLNSFSLYKSQICS